MIDGYETAESPAWWLKRLSEKLEARQYRLALLDRYYGGDAPLPEGAESCRDSYRAFQRKSRTNFAELVVDAPLDRMTFAGFASVDAGDDGQLNAEAQRIWRANGMGVGSKDVLEDMLALSEGYMIAGPPTEADRETPLITAEDPREVITAHDPSNPRDVRAALKVFYDEDHETEYAYLYLPGEVHVASRKGVKFSQLARRKIDGVLLGPVSQRVLRHEIRQRGCGWMNPVQVSLQSWSWDEDLSGDSTPKVPVVRFQNRRGFGEFEKHLDVLDRINHMVLQRMVIATMQAFRQRAIKGELPDTDSQGNKIDYDKVFTADPGAFWELPPGVDIWESAQVDLSGILAGVKDDIMHLAAVTRTPLTYLTPDAANGSAEGAQLMREGVVFKAEDRIARASVSFVDVMQRAFEQLDQSPPDLRALWKPADRLSLAERADAASKATDVPFRTKMVDIWQFTPEQVDAMETERAADALLNALNNPAPAAPATGRGVGPVTDATAPPPPQVPPAPSQSAF